MRGGDALGARSGPLRAKAPAFIEAVTYRMGPHTTSDDPTRYRDAAEVERWRERDPLTRLEAHLRRSGAWDDAFAAEVAAAGDTLAAGMRDAALTAQTRPRRGARRRVRRAAPWA